MFIFEESTQIVKNEEWPIKGIENFVKPNTKYQGLQQSWQDIRSRNHYKFPESLLLGLHGYFEFILPRAFFLKKCICVFSYFMKGKKVIKVYFTISKLKAG